MTSIASWPPLGPGFYSGASGRIHSLGCAIVREYCIVVSARGEGRHGRLEITYQNCRDQL